MGLLPKLPLISWFLPTHNHFASCQIHLCKYFVKIHVLFCNNLSIPFYSNPISFSIQLLFSIPIPRQIFQLKFRNWNSHPWWWSTHYKWRKKFCLITHYMTHVIMRMTQTRRSRQDMEMWSQTPCRYRHPILPLPPDRSSPDEYMWRSLSPRSWNDRKWWWDNIRVQYTAYAGEVVKGRCMLF